jgi:hypothetical protein
MILEKLKKLQADLAATMETLPEPLQWELGEAIRLVAIIEARLTIPRIKVTSSQIKSVGYHKFLQVLEVEFNNESVYHYLDVPREVFEELATKAVSVGSYFSTQVKGKYTTHKIRGPKNEKVQEAPPVQSTP